jgi:hypothetical protein
MSEDSAAADGADNVIRPALAPSLLHFCSVTRLQVLLRPGDFNPAAARHGRLHGLWNRARAFINKDKLSFPPPHQLRQPIFHVVHEPPVALLRSMRALSLNTLTDCFFKPFWVSCSGLLRAPL